MMQPIQSGRALLTEIDNHPAETPVLWWLGHCGYALKYRKAIFYLDPYLSSDPSQPRRTPPPVRPAEIGHAGLVLCSHADPHHLDPGTVPAMLTASRRAKLVIPKAAAGPAHQMGIGYERMVTTDSGLRVEYLDDRIYAVPSAHPSLDWTPLGGYPYLGFLVRFGGYTIYHGGDGVPYPDLAARLKPYSVTVALLPIGGRAATNFEIQEAAQLAEEIGAEWLVPMHYDTFVADTVDINRFIEHMLGHRPLQRFKIFQCGERWELPER